MLNESFLFWLKYRQVLTSTIILSTFMIHLFTCIGAYCLLPQTFSQKPCIFLIRHLLLSVKCKKVVSVFPLFWRIAILCSDFFCISSIKMWISILSWYLTITGSKCVILPIKKLISAKYHLRPFCIHMTICLASNIPHNLSYVTPWSNAYELFL